VLGISQMDGDWHRIEADLGPILTKGKLIRLCWAAARQARVDMTADKPLPFNTSDTPKAIFNNTSSNATILPLSFAYMLKQMRGQMHGHSSSARCKYANCH